MHLLIAVAFETAVAFLWITVGYMRAKGQTCRQMIAFYEELTNEVAEVEVAAKLDEPLVSPEFLEGEFHAVQLIEKHINTELPRLFNRKRITNEQRRIH